MDAHEPRRYRGLIDAGDLVAFGVAVGETDLLVLAEREMRAEARAAARYARRRIESHAVVHPEMLDARRPLAPPADLTGVVAAMYRASAIAGTGPMAAVAGAIAEVVARELAKYLAASGGRPEVIVENGGDVFAISGRERVAAIGAGSSRWHGRLGLVLPPGQRAVCTSSGTVGHSDSGGRADAVVVVGPDGAVADALATATGNRVASEEDVRNAVEWARARADIDHVVVICGETLGAWGDLELRGL